MLKIENQERNRRWDRWLRELAIAVCLQAVDALHQILAGVIPGLVQGTQSPVADVWITTMRMQIAHKNGFPGSANGNKLTREHIQLPGQ